MLFRLIGACFVFASCACFGFCLSARDGLRIRELTEFKKALLMLSSEIGYMKTTVPAAFSQISKRVSNPLREFLAGFADSLEEGLRGGGLTAYELWSASLASFRDRLHLYAEDADMLDDFGKTLGYLDTKMQLNAIALAVEYIGQKTGELSIRNEKNKRMYRSLGLLGGALLAVVLW